MVDNKEENKEAVPTSPAVGQSPAPEICLPPEKPPMSKGERWFNHIVYKLLNYWVNLGLSVYVTDLFVHGGGKLDPSRGWFKRKFNAGVEGITEGLSATKMIGRKPARRFAEILLSSFTLNSGGNILLIPTKWLEDHKRPIVHWLNKKLGVDMRAPDGHEETPDEIYIEQEQPKQSWPRMIFRRLLGLVATTSAGIAIDWTAAAKLKEPEMRHGEKYTHKPGQENFTENVVEAVKYIPGATKLMEKNKTAERYIKYAALDWMYTVITSMLLHKTNGAKAAHLPHEIDRTADPVGHTEYDKVVLDKRQRSFVQEAPKPDARKQILDKPTPASLGEKITAQRTGDNNDLTLAP